MPSYRAPLRIDLAGGTLDIWPLYLQLDAPATVNVAVTRYAVVSLGIGPKRPASTLVARLLRALGRPGMRLTTHVECPRGAGLGGSSALAVALVRALLQARGERPSRERILRLTRDIESQDIETPTGDQDYIAALHGGCSIIRFGPGGPRRETPPSCGQALVDRIVLFYTGRPHFSGINNWEVFRRFFDGDAAVRRRLQSIARIATDMAAALSEGDLDAAGLLVRQEWRYRRGLARRITTPSIEKAFAIGRRLGALAGKVCGAGGGGCAFLYARAGEAARLARALSLAGYPLLPVRLATRGLHRLSSSPRAAL